MTPERLEEIRHNVRIRVGNRLPNFEQYSKELLVYVDELRAKLERYCVDDEVGDWAALAKSYREVSAERDQLLLDVTQARAEVEGLKRVIWGVEWVMDDNDTERCPSCDARRGSGRHEDGCDISAALSKGKP